MVLGFSKKGTEYLKKGIWDADLNAIGACTLITPNLYIMQDCGPMFKEIFSQVSIHMYGIGMWWVQTIKRYKLCMLFLSYKVAS